LQVWLANIAECIFDGLHSTIFVVQKRRPRD
jgi:hypothetical protein